ncbi:S8 family serine peptidase [Thalassotalea litorea]|uniref:S8 family serine peptidase n=1 Tax=Thalassotalea litorea TaxID=2020715 RepID=UPI003736D4F9
MADDGNAQSLNKIIPNKEKIANIQALKTRQDNTYFVVLKDEPLANYKTHQDSAIFSSDSMANGAPAIELHSTQARAYRQTLKQKQQHIISTLNDAFASNVKIGHDYQIILNAVTVELSEQQVAFLKRSDSVERIEKADLHYIQTATGPEFIGAKNVWQETSEYVGTKGEGVIIGIIDTGINATHPAFAAVGDDGYEHENPLGKGNYLGDCQQFPTFCNDKLIGIVSYPEIIDAYPDIKNTDLDNIDDKVRIGYDFNGHGTHVAATAAGNVVNNVNYRLVIEQGDDNISEESAFNFDSISGVAPHANIVSYQVCDHNGSCYSELTIRALEHAIENGVSVINYSVGGGANSPWNSVATEAFLNARTAGLHVAVAAGNAGPTAETVGAPGNAPWVTTVAAYTHDQSFSDKTLSGFSGGTIVPANMAGKGATPNYTGQVIVPETDKACLEPFDQGTFNGEIVVCERGDIPRVTKGINVRAGGAGGLILINVDTDIDSLHADLHVIPAIQLSHADGETLLDWLAQGSDHMATIGESTLIRDPELGDIAGVFTSRGPNLPFPEILAPDIAAPGVDIYAAYAEDKPFTENSNQIAYASLSGTSMASPHVAGAMALIHAIRPEWTPAQLQSAIMSTAVQQTYKDDNYSGNPERSDFFDQGAGSIRVHKAINAGLLLDVSEQDYLAADPAEGGNPNDLNTTSVVMTSCISSCSWTRDVTATADGSWIASYEYLNPGFDIVVSPASFSLKAGESQTLTFTATANENLVDEWVHGYVNLANSASDKSDTHFQAVVHFQAGEVVKEISAALNNVDNTIVIEDVYTSGSLELQRKAFGLVKTTTVTGTAEAADSASERNSPGTNLHTVFSHPIVIKPYTKRLIVEIGETLAPDLDLYVGIDEDGNGLPNAIEIYYSLKCISGNVDSKERCVIENPTSGNYWLFAHNFAGSVPGEEDDISLEYAIIEYASGESFDIDMPSQVGQDEKFDISLTINGAMENGELMPLEEGQNYYGLLELGTTASQKRNIGSTLLKVTGKAPVEFVNSPPEINQPPANQSYQLDSNNQVSIEIDVSNVFIDPDQDPLTLTVSGADNLAINLGVLSGSFSKPGTYTIELSADDGSDIVTANFDITIVAAPVIEPPKPEKGSSGGTQSPLSILLIAIMLMCRQTISRR